MTLKTLLKYLNVTEVGKGKKVKSKKYYTAKLDYYFEIGSNDTVESFMKEYFLHAYSQGVKEGKKIRSAEIKNLLDDE